MRFALTVVLILINSICYSQDSHIVGEWKNCFVVGSKKRKVCEENDIYIFYANDRLEHNVNRNGKLISSKGQWTVEKNKLTIDMDDNNNATYYPYTNKFKWIDENTFYTIGREGFLGPKVYHYFIRIN